MPGASATSHSGLEAAGAAARLAPRLLRIEFPSGLIINDVTLHTNSGKCWAAPPGKPWVKDGSAVIDEATGKAKYLPVVDFATHGVRRAWSAQIVHAMRSAHPELALPTDAGGER